MESEQSIEKELILGSRKNLIKFFNENNVVNNDVDEITRILNFDYGDDAKTEDIASDLNFLTENMLIKFDEKNNKIVLTMKGRKFHKKILKEERNDAKVMALLSNEKPSYNSLGMGIKDDIFYYGTKIYEGKKSHDAIVTSEKKIFIDWGTRNEIKEDFGLNYRFPLFDDLVDFTWSNYSISNWLLSNMEVPTLKEVFDKIVEINKTLMWYPDERWHEFVTLDIISTYFLEIFETKARTLITAEKGSGKTRQCMIYQLLVFNPLMSSDWTKSTLFRTIESTKGTPIIDNFDQINEELKNDIMSIFKQYKKGTKSVRTEGQIRRKPVAYDLFCSMILNNLFGLSEVDEDRSNKVILLKCLDKKIVNKRLDKNSCIWRELRDNLFILALSIWKDVRNTYENLVEDTLIGRDLERLIPHLTLAKLISPELYKTIVDFEIEKMEQNMLKNLDDDWIYNAIKIISGSFGRGENGTWVSLKEIVSEIINELYPDLKDEKLRKKSRGIGIYLGKIFKNNPLFKGRQVKGVTEYFFTHENIIKFCEIKNFYDIIEEYNSTNSTHSTNGFKNDVVEKVDNVDKKTCNVLANGYYKELSDLKKYIGEKVPKDEIKKRFPSNVIEVWLEDGRIGEMGEYFIIM